jgi:Acetyltransferases, including N-acetylases of ribosomal proteins
MKKQFVIYGEEVILKSIKGEDLELIRKWRNRDNIRKWFLDSSAIKEEHQIKWFYNYLSKENDYMFIIECVKTGIKIGAAALYNIDTEKKTAEFGRLMIGEEFARGKGFAVNATKTLCEFGFQQMNLKEIYLSVLSNNTVALSVYEKCGFKSVKLYNENDKDILFMIKT